MTDAWTLVFDGWDPADEGRREALCTLGNGRFATRGAAPESRADGVHYPGTYAAGCYNRLRDDIGGRVVENESMVNLPNWLDLRFAVDDGDWFDLAAVRVLEHRLELDLRRGMLGRTAPVRRRGRADAPRCASAGSCTWHEPYLAGLHTVFTAEDWSGRLRVASGIDGSVTNTGVRALPGHGEPPPRRASQTGEPDPRTVLLVGPHHAVGPARRRGGPHERSASAARTTSTAPAAARSRAGSRTSWSWTCVPASRSRSRRSSRWSPPATSRSPNRPPPPSSCWPPRRASTSCSRATSWPGTSCGGGSAST